MLCRSCHHLIERDAPACRVCGAPRAGASVPLVLVLPDSTRMPIAGRLTIGRAEECTVRLEHPSVSRRHARISPAGDGRAVLEDDGSRHGTFLDGRRVVEPVALRDGARIRCGDRELLVERPREDAESGRTRLVRTRDSDGLALKRLAAGERAGRWILQHRASGRMLRLGPADAQLLALLDGERSAEELAAAAEAQLGPDGPARLTKLIADLSRRGFLWLQDGPAPPAGRVGWWRRLVGPRELAFRGAGAILAAVYRRGGWLLFSRPALVATAALAAAGIGAFAAVVAGGGATPFVVAGSLSLGGVVFFAGRIAVVGLHELAHGLALASLGRRPRRAGIKLVLIFPYAFVDTSEAWFEPSRRRIAVSVAGPASDLTLAGAFSVVALAAPGPTARAVAFQLALGAYIGAFFNLNPLLDRDGYHVLVDLLGEPGLRTRARAALARRLAGGPGADARVLRRYGLAGVAWSALSAACVSAMSLRYLPRLEAAMPLGATWGAWLVLSVLWTALLAPLAVTVVPPLLARIRAL